MKRRRGDAKAKARIVLEGLQGKSGADLCHEHQINQRQSYQWRDQLLAKASKACEVHQDAQQDARLAREHTRFKTLVAELTLEVQKSDEWLGCIAVHLRPFEASGARRLRHETQE